MSGAAKTPAGDPPHAAKALFLERQSYRRRRLLDISRLLPLLGVLLLQIPLLWPGGDDPQVTPAMSTAITYVFAVWALLILGGALFGIAARRWGGDTGHADPEA